MADLSSFYVGSTQFGVGKTNAISSGSLRTWATNLELGDAPLSVFDHPMVGGGTVSVGSVYATPRDITFDLVVEWVSTNSERNLRDAVEDYADALGVGGSPAIFRADRLDASGATISRVLDTRLVTYPQSQSPMAVYTKGASYGRMIVPVQLQSVGMPLFRDRVATTSNTVALSTSSQAWGAINNTGYAACPVKLVLSSIVGTWTSITFVNTTTSQTLVWTDNSFANADYFDFGVGADAATQGLVPTWNNGNPSTTGLGPLTLARGNNSGTCIGVGGTSGTVSIYYRRYWLTP